MSIWSRSEVIALSGLLIAVVSAIAALLVVPEIRRWLALDNAQSFHKPNPASVTSPAVASVRSVVVNTARLIPYRKGDKWGFCDGRKQIVIEPKYDEVSPFSE